MALTFWVNSHFCSKIDFVTNVVPKKKKIDFILVPTVNPLMENNDVANRGTIGIGNVDVTIKIIFKKYHISIHINIHVNILFLKINLSILTKLKM